MKKKLLLSAFLILVFSIQSKSQTPTVQDCMGAIPVCLNTYDQTNGYTGVGPYNDIPAGSCPTTCMSAGELNSVWYTFTVQTTGMFDFRITPQILSDDYDWALFNLTTNDCSSLANLGSMPYLEVSCNWSADGGITGANNLSPNTGVNCWGAAATANNPQIWVTAGSTFYLNISNYTGYGAGHGYQLDFTHSSATIFDNVPPYLLAIPNQACGATTINITMSENVLCSSVSTADFTIAGHSVTVVSGAVCALGGTTESNFTLTISPALDPGSHTLCINGSASHISDLCGNLTNPANVNNCRTFTVSGAITTVSASPTSICAGQTSTLTAGGATSYSWSNGLGVGSPKVVTPGTTTTYTVTGTTAGCTSSAAVTVTVTPGPSVSISASANPICAGSSTTLTGVGATSYNWSNGLGAGTSKVVSPITTTTYTVTGTTAGCTGTAQITITVNPVPNVSVNASPNPICLGSSTTLTAGGASSYIWSGGLGPGNPVSASPIITTTYTVTGTTSGCTNSATVTVTVNPSIPITINAAPNPICAGTNTTLTAGGASTYSWSGGLGAGNPKIVNPVITTTYTVTGTDVAGCTGSTTVTVTVNSNPIVTATASPPAICQGATSVLTGNGAASYIWSGGLGVGNPVNASPASTTTYTVTGTSGGCTGSATVTVTVNPVTANAGSDWSQGACASSTNTLNGSGTGTAPLSYSWSPVTGLSNPNIANPVANPAATTTYTLTVTNGTGCTATDAATVTVNTLSANAGVDGNTGACASSTYTLNGSAVGVGPYTYAWTPIGGLSNPNISNPIADPAITSTYTLTVTDSYGCTASDAVIVNVSTLTANAGSDGNSGACASSTFNLNGSAVGVGPFTYTWTPAGGLSNPNISNPVADPAITTTYTLTVSDTYGCTASDAAVVNVAPFPTSSAGTDANIGICAGAPSTSLNGTGTGTAPLSYLWTPATGLSNPAISNPVADPATTTTYILTVTDSYGCTATDAVIVNVDPLPTSNAGTDANIGACTAAPNANLNGTGTGTAPLSYSWLPITGLSNPNIANPVADPSVTTTYTLTVTDNYGCSASDAMVVNIAPLPTSNAGTDANIGACAGAPNTTLNGTGTGTAPLSYSWTPATGLSNPAISNPTADPAATTTYILTVTDSYGCTASDAVVVNVAPLPTANAGIDANIGACVAATNANLSGTGTGTGPLTYLWSPPTGLSDPNISNPVADPAATTNYTLTVTDNYGCSASDGLVVTVSPLPTANSGSDANVGACAGAPNVNLNGSGTGTAPLSYSWLPTTGLSNPNISGPIADPAVTTSYTLTVTDSYGCTATDNAVVTVDPLPTANAGSDGNIGACGATGYNLNGAGTGTGPLVYTWIPITGLSNPAIANPTATPAVTTTYTLMVTDSYGCSATDAALVTVNSAATANAGIDGNIGSCITSSYLMNGSGTGPAPLSYSWTPVAGLSDPNIVNPIAHPTFTTTYTLTVTDMYGCTASDDAVVNVSPLPTSNAGLDGNIGGCVTSIYTLNGSGAGAVPLTYNWTPTSGLNNPNITNPIAQPAVTTNYTLTVTDTYGCSASEAATVTVAPLPTSNAGLDAIVGTCISSTTVLNGSGTGSAPISYTWNPSTGLNNALIATPICHPSATTTYTLIVTDTFGCTATDAMVVTVDPLPLANAGLDITIGTCSGNSTVLNGTGIGTGPFSYSWTPISGLSNPSISNPTATPSVTTIYTLTITDSYGCTASNAMVVTLYPLPNANAGGDASIGSCSSSSTTLNGSGTGAIPLTYNWMPVLGLSDPNISNPVAQPPATIIYTLMVIDTYGCTATDAVVITVNPMPSSNAGTDASIGICPNSSTSLNGTGTGTSPLLFLWSPAIGLSNPGIQNPVANPSVNTSYTLTVTDTYGCTATDAVWVTVNPLPVVNAGADVTIGSCLSSIAYLNGTAIGSLPMTYFWTPNTGLNNPNIANPQAHPSSTTTYTLTVTDTYGCSGSDAIVISVDPLPTAEAGNNATIGACPSSTTALNGSGTGNGITFQWTPSTGLSNSNIPNPIAKPAITTTYILTVTDIYGCAAIDNITVVVVPLPNLILQPVNPTICTGSNVNLTAGGALSYAWTPTTGLSSPNGSSVNAFPNITTTYTVTGADIYGCTNSTSITVTVSPIPVVIILPAAPAICAGDSVLLTATGASTYNWSPAGGLSGTTGASNFANPGATVTYTVTGTLNGCNGLNMVTVTINPLPNVTFSAMADVCSNDAAISLTNGTPVGGVYSGTGVTGTSFNPNTAGPGAHTLTYSYTDINNCTSSASQNITVKPAPIVSIAPSNPSICIGTSVTLNASGAIDYSWDPPTGLSDTVGSAVTANPTVTSTYIVTGQANGCTNTATITVDVYTNIAVQILPNDVSICPGSYAVLTAVGASTYTWDPPDGLSSTTAASVSATPDNTTTYTVTGVDPGGCFGTATATVSLYPSVLMDFIAQPYTGCPPLIVDFDFMPSPLIEDSSWIWNFGDNGSGSANTSVELNPSHVYYDQSTYIVSLSGTTTDGCGVAGYDTITVYDAPIADFIANPEIVTTENPTIDFIDQSIGAYFWDWTFGDPGSEEYNSSTNQNTSHIYADSGYYDVTLIIENLHGCSDTTVRNVTVHDAFAFFVPNAFSPNEDDVNDLFLPKGVGFKTETFEMWIFDRWGKGIYYSNNVNQGWDGSDQKSGKVQLQGVFSYIITLRDDANLRRKFMGTVTLLQ